MKRRLSISEADIADGIPGNPRLCAIARALKRLFPKLESTVIGNGADGSIIINLHQQVISWDEGRLLQPYKRLDSRWRLSKNGQKWLRRFDRMREVHPATFEIVQIG